MQHTPASVLHTSPPEHAGVQLIPEPFGVGVDVAVGVGVDSGVAGVVVGVGFVAQCLFAAQ